MRHDNQHDRDEDLCFRADEQTSLRLPVGNESQTRSPNHPRQATRGKARPQRPVPMWQRSAVQTLLPTIGASVMASIATTTFRDDD